MKGYILAVMFLSMFMLGNSCDSNRCHSCSPAANTPTLFSDTAIDPVAPMPEPSGALIMGLGLLVAAGLRRK